MGEGGRGTLDLPSLHPGSPRLGRICAGSLRYREILNVYNSIDCMDVIFYISLCISVLKSSGVGWVGGSFSFLMSLTFYVCMVVFFFYFYVPYNICVFDVPFTNS